MKNKYRHLKSVFAYAMMVLLVFGFICYAAEKSPITSSLEVAGGVRVVEKTMALSSLTIGEGASLAAPEGKSLTMTVYGVGTPIKPGSYKGDIVISVTDKLMLQPGGLMSRSSKPTEYRTAIVIEDGKYVPGKSIPAAVQGGKVTDKATTGVSISSREYNFQGIIVKGNSEYTIDGVNINFEGDYGNDFCGYGSGIVVIDNSKLTINNSDIHLMGITRTAFHAGGNSVTTLNNCNISNISSASDKMKMMWAWPLGFRGTNRSTQCTESATVYYNNCRIMTNGWGVCSVDGGTDTHMYFKDSTLELKGPRARGYGAFSIGKCFISYDHCTLNVNGNPLLMGGGGEGADGEITNGTIVNTPLSAVMMFKGGCKVKIDKDSTLNTGSSTFVVKGSGYLTIDNAKLNPGNGVILQLMDDDVMPSNSIAAFIPPIGEVDSAIPGRDLTTANPKQDVFMTVSNMEVKGDFYNSTTNLKAVDRKTGHERDMAGWTDILDLMALKAPGSAGSTEGAAPPAEGVAPARGAVTPEGAGMPGMSGGTGAVAAAKNLDLNFANVKVNGVISAATQAYRDGVTKIDASNCEELSNVTQTAAEPMNNGVIVSFDKSCVWTVAGTSYLTSLTIAEGAVIKAPEGKKLTMTVDGVKKTIGAGTYKGKIKMAVN